MHSRTHPRPWHTLGSAFWLGRAIGRRPNHCSTWCNRTNKTARGSGLGPFCFAWAGTRADRPHACMRPSRPSCSPPARLSGATGDRASSSTLDSLSKSSSKMWLYSVQTANLTFSSRLRSPMMCHEARISRNLRHSARTLRCSTLWILGRSRRLKARRAKAVAPRLRCDHSCCLGEFGHQRSAKRETCGRAPVSEAAVRAAISLVRRWRASRWT